MKLAGLYVRQPWADAIVHGHKTIETRHYPVPEKHLGHWVAVIATSNTATKAGQRRSQVAGLVCLRGWHLYRSEEEFTSEYAQHRVSPHDPDYGWREDKAKYGWVLEGAVYCPGSGEVHRGGRVWTTVDMCPAIRAMLHKARR